MNKISPFLWLDNKPENIIELVRHPKAMQAMMRMVKFDKAKLEAAAHGD